MVAMSCNVSKSNCSQRSFHEGLVLVALFNLISDDWDFCHNLSGYALKTYCFDVGLKK